MRVAFAVAVVLMGCGSGSTGGSGGSGAGSGGGSGVGGASGGGTGGAGGSSTGGGTGGAGGSQTGGGSGGAGGGGTVDAGVLNAFVAIGYAGRTTVSCDDGLSWVGNQSEDDQMVCFTTAPLPDGGSSDCDHHYRPGRGIAAGNGWFVATFGWGDPGGVRRSRDGITWQTTLSGTTFAGLVHGNGKFLAASRQPRVSHDDAATWDAGGVPQLMNGATTISNVRRAGFGGDAGVFVVVGEDGAARDVMVSATNGATWTRPSTLPAGCGAAMQWEGGIVDGNGTLVMVGGDGTVCRSADNGVTWTSVSLGQTIGSRLIWTGTEFMVWGGNKLFRSANGVTWVSMATSLKITLADGGMQNAALDLGPVARSPNGTFVGVNGGWQQWYDKQLFLRSTDGLAWTSLPKNKYTASHPMTHIVWGPAQRSAVCP